MKKALIVLGAAISVSACFAVTDDLDRLHDSQTLVMTFSDMYQHANQRFEFKIIDNTNFVKTRGIVLNLKMTDGHFKITVPLTIPSTLSGYRVDFWADENNNGNYDFDPNAPYSQLDHSRRVFHDGTGPPDEFAKVTHVDNSYLLGFEHHIDFVNLNVVPEGTTPPVIRDTGLDAKIHIDNIDKIGDGKMAQIRVADPSGHIVGLYRFRTSSQLADFKIPGCIEQGNLYDVDLYIDANGNNDANGNGYDAPSAGPGNDLGWRQSHQQADKGTGGLSATFDAADAGSGNVDVGPP